MIKLGTVQLENPDLSDTITIITDTDLFIAKNGDIRTYNKTTTPSLRIELVLRKLDDSDKSNLEAHFDYSNSVEFIYEDYNGKQYYVRYTDSELLFIDVRNFHETTLRLEGYEAS